MTVNAIQTVVRPEPAPRYGPRPVFYCPICEAAFSLDDPGVEIAFGRPFHVTPAPHARGEVWERHLLRPLPRDGAAASVN